MEGKYKHNNIQNSEIRIFNQRFNQNYIKNLGLELDIDKFEGYKTKKDDSVPYYTVWLKNIDRLFKLLPKSQILSSYNLIDIGSGLGISTNYIYLKYKFKSVIGIDINQELVNHARLINKDLQINFYVKDVSSLLLQYNKKYIIYMFNPFGFKTLKTFLDLNIENFKKNKSLILYANDLYINEIDKNYNVQILRNNFYNLSVIKF